MAPTSFGSILHKRPVDERTGSILNDNAGRPTSLGPVTSVRPDAGVQELARKWLSGVPENA
jgi:hypothetical protein